MIHRFLFIIFLFIYSSTVRSQEIYGMIIDGKHKPIPYSTVFVKEISLGTAANEEGLFKLHLPEGTYNCVFQCMGYQTVNRTIIVNMQNEPLMVELPDIVYALKEVEVSDGGEDPAYRIMRRVIRNAPLYAGMVKSFDAEVYIRGSLNVKKISSMIKLMAREDLKESNIREGDTYLEESVNEISFTAPNLTRQKVKSIHSTFPGGNENRSSGAIGFISGNIYRPNAFGNARSPLAPGAFKYYRFRYEGVNTYGDVVVDKIKVIPRGDGPQYVRGYLYIIEGLWCLYSLNISVDEQLGMTIQLNQSFGEVRKGAWLPVNNRFKIDMDLLGNEGGFQYSTSIRYTNLVVNPPDFKPRKPAESKIKTDNNKAAKQEARNAKFDKKAAELMAIDNPSTSEAYKLAKINNRKAELNRRDSLRDNHEYVETYKTVFDSNARKSDSVYWNRIRPIPLASNELKSVKAFDSLQFRHSSKATDSTKIKTPKNKKIFNTILWGGNFEPDTIQSFRTDGLINPFGLSFNTVDGFVYKIGFNYHRTINKKSAITAGFKPGFAFSRKAFLWDAGIGYSGKGRFKNSIGLHGGSASFDYNSSGGAYILENSVSSLFFRQNLMRLYQKDYIELKNSVNIHPELNLTTGIYISESRVLDNESDFSFFYKGERDYKSNQPDNPDFRMINHRGFMFHITMTIKAMPFYVIKDGIRVPRPGMNNSPTYTVSWKKGIPFTGIDTDFDLVTVGIKQKIKTGLKDNLEYSFGVGYFLYNGTVYFDDFNHFQTQPLVVGIKSFMPVTQMGDYYRYSNDSYYFEGHLVFSSPSLLLKKLPLIRSRMWDENLIFNYLNVPEYLNCIEIGYGIGNYFYNIGFFAGFEKNKFRTAGLRISLSILSKKEIVIGM